MTIPTNLLTLGQLHKKYFKNVLTLRGLKRKMILEKAKMLKLGKTWYCYEDSADFIFKDFPDLNPRILAAKQNEEIKTDDII